MANSNSLNKSILKSGHFKKCKFCCHLMRTQKNLEYIVKVNDSIRDIKQAKEGERWESKEGYCNECSKFI